MGQRRYRAFISYCHRDQAVAVRLHHALETYAIPSKLVGKVTQAGDVPKRLIPIFKDREELPAADNLGEAVDAALAASDALIVICSPASAKSEWVNKEVERFKQIHGGGRVFPALIDGEPKESFPPALRVRYEHGRPTGKTAEPIAADLRPNADGQKLATLKLVAGLTGLELDQLVQRDNQRRQRRLALVAAASLAGMAGTSGLAAYALQQRDEARAQRAEADGLIEYMLTDLRGKLEPVGKLDVLDGVGRKALDYYARQKLDQLSADELGRRAKAMLLVAEVGDLRGNKDAARRGFEQAARSTAELLQRDPDNWQRVYDHAQSEFWLAYEANARGDNKAAMPHFIAYRDLGKRMLQIAPDKLESKVEAASADVNLGVALTDERRLGEALPLFRNSALRFKSILPRTRDIALNASTSFGHEATTLSAIGRDKEAVSVRQRQLKLLSEPPLRPDDKEVQESEAIIASQLAASALALGKPADFRHWIDRSLRTWDQLLSLDPTNEFWRSQQLFAQMNQTVELSQRAPAVSRIRLERIIGEQRRIFNQGKNRDAGRNLLRMIAFHQAIGGGWQAWQTSLVDQFWEERASLDDGQMSALAFALYALGVASRRSNPHASADAWKKSASLLKDRPLSSFDEIIRGLTSAQPNHHTDPRSAKPSHLFAGILKANSGKAENPGLS